MWHVVCILKFYWKSWILVFVSIYVECVSHHSYARKISNVHYYIKINSARFYLLYKKKHQRKNDMSVYKNFLLVLYTHTRPRSIRYEHHENKFDEEKKMGIKWNAFLSSLFWNANFLPFPIHIRAIIWELMRRECNKKNIYLKDLFLRGLVEKENNFFWGICVFDLSYSVILWRF